MANVMFKRGLHSALPKTGIVDGAFYLTTDTNRLYVGQGSALVELNKSITTVTTKDQLPTAGVAEGQFYYVTTGNILCWYGTGYDSETGGNVTKWWQINWDTTLKNSDAATSVGYAAGTKTASITTEFEDTLGNTVKGTFSIVGVDATEVSTDGNIIKITSHDTKTSLKTAANATKGVLESYEDSTKASTINFVGGDNVTVSSDADGNITISAAEAEDMFNTDASMEFDPNGKLTITVTDKGGDVSDFVTPTVTYGNGKSATFKNGTAALDVYDKDQVDQLLRTADALVFMGVIDAKDIPAITTVQNGAVYKIGTNNTGISGYNIGDLVIAKGTESATSHLITDGEWVVVTSGDDQVISGTVDKDNHSWSVSDQADELAGQTLVAGAENIKLSSSVDSKGHHITTTIIHDVAGKVDDSKTVSGSDDVTQGATGTVSFTAITGLTRDTNGHVVGATTKTLTVVDTHNELKSMEITTSGGGATAETIGGTATVKTTVTGNDSDEVEDTFNITSETLRVTTSTSNSVAAVNVDLIWGSF